MKITLALRMAQKHIYPIRFVNQWVVTMPWRDIDGPTQHSQPVPYRRAQIDAAQYRAQLALELMGYNYDTQWRASQRVYEGADWRAVVRDIVKGGK